MINFCINKYDKVNETFLPNMSADELNDFFVNLGCDARKHVKPQGSFMRHLKGRVVQNNWDIAT